MFRVAARTFLAGTRRNVIGRMQSLAGIKPRIDLAMAVETLERRLSAELVSTAAVGRSVEGLMRPRQWSRRDLGPRRGQKHREHEKPERKQTRRKSRSMDNAAVHSARASLELAGDDTCWRELISKAICRRHCPLPMRSASPLPHLILAVV